MPMSTGIRDPRDGTRGACRAARAQRATRTSRPKEGLRHRRQTTQTTRQHRHRLELPCPAHASVVPRSNLLPLAAQKGLFLDSPLPYAKLQNPSLQFPTSSPAPRARSPALVPQLSFQRARGLNPSSAKTTSANQDIPAVARLLFVTCKKPVPAVSIVSVDTDLFRNARLLKSNVAFRSPAPQEFQCRTLRPSSLVAPKIPKDRKLPLRL